MAQQNQHQVDYGNKRKYKRARNHKFEDLKGNTEKLQKLKDYVKNQVKKQEEYFQMEKEEYNLIE